MKSHVIRPNSNHKNEIKNNQIYIPKVSSMIISEKIMQNLLPKTSGYPLIKNLHNQNSSPYKRNYKQTDHKNQKNVLQFNYLYNQINDDVTNQIRQYIPSNKSYLSSSQSTIPQKYGQVIKQFNINTISSTIHYDKNSTPLYKLITRIKNQSKDKKRSISQLPTTISTERMIKSSERVQKMRKKSVRFHDQVECLFIGLGQGNQEYKYKFFEPLDQEIEQL